LSFIDARLIEQGFSPAKASLYASIPNWIMPLTAIFAGQWVDRTGARFLCIGTASVAATISMLLLGYTSFSLLGVVLFGVLGASAAGVIMSLTIDAMPGSARAFGMGIFFTTYFICVLPTPAIGGWLGDTYGSAGDALAFGALLFMLTALSSLCFRLFFNRSATTS